MSMQLLSLPAFTDNYIWLLHNGQSAVVVDPGAAAPVLNALSLFNLKLTTILITHHHHDHTGGVANLLQNSQAIVYGPATEQIPEPFVHLTGADKVDFFGGSFQVIETPGHTAGHIAFYYDQTPHTPLLFCGDTLFSGGCGRLFEGTPAQMLTSLKRLKNLATNTQICAAHEYTLSNLEFARAVEPHNQALLEYSQYCTQLRANNQPTLPAKLDLELRINPFLRTEHNTVKQAVHTFNPSTNMEDEVAVFANLRQWKNQFK